MSRNQRLNGNGGRLFACPRISASYWTGIAAIALPMRSMVSSSNGRLMAKLKRTLRERGTVVRWNPPHLWHVTLKFLGEPKDPEQIPRVLETWQPKLDDVTFGLSGIGVFPTPEAARVLWVPVRVE